MNPVRRRFLSIFLCLCAVAAVGQTAQVAPSCTSASVPKWRAADVFVAVGAGRWRVFRPCFQGFYDAVTDNVGGSNNGSALDNTWHLVGTDAGSGTLSKVVRFSISPHDPSSVPAPPEQLSSFDSSAGNSVNPQAIVIDNFGNIIVANASPATINVFNASGGLVKSFALGRNVDKTLVGADLSADGKTLYYTSGGQNLRALDLTSSTSSPTITVVTSVSGAKMYGIRVMPAGGFPLKCGTVNCPTAGANSIAGFVIANLKNVLVLDSSGNVITQYAVSGQSNLQEVALSPLVSDSQNNSLSACCSNPLPDKPSNTFWAASPTSGTLYQMDFTQTGNSVASYGTGTSGVFSLVTYAGFGADQPIATEFPTVNFAPLAPNFTQTNGATYQFAGNDQLKLTGYSTLFPATFSTNVSVFATAIQPSAGISDLGLPCTKTIAVSPSSTPTLCTVWEIDAQDPTTGDATQFPTSSLMLLAIASPLPTAPPPTTPRFDGNTYFLRNELYDDTLGFRSTDPVKGSTFSVYSLNQKNIPNGGCTYSPPVIDGATFNNPGNITFRFTCTATDGSGNNITPELKPRISIVQTFPGTSFAPQPFVPGLSGLTGGTCCLNTSTGTPYYRYDAQTNTWVINVSFSGFSGSFLATTYDDNKLISAFDVGFSISK